MQHFSVPNTNIMADDNVLLVSTSCLGQMGETSDHTRITTLQPVTGKMFSVIAP